MSGRGGDKAVPWLVAVMAGASMAAGLMVVALMDSPWKWLVFGLLVVIWIGLSVWLRRRVRSLQWADDDPWGPTNNWDFVLMMLLALATAVLRDAPYSAWVIPTVAVAAGIFAYRHFRRSLTPKTESTP